MKVENFNISKMYTFSITIYPNDKTKYNFQKGELSHDLSGLLFADNCRDAMKKLYTQLGVEYGKTICHPNIRHFITEQIPYINEDKLFCTGFSTR